MRKIGCLLFALIIFTLSGCAEFNSDTMVCTLNEQNNSSISYEIKYSDKNINNITLVKNIDFSTFDDVNFNEQIKTIKADAKKINKINGLNEDIQIDKKMVTISIDIDMDDYDMIKDSQYLFNVYFKNIDLDGIYSIREKLMDN